ncbi:MAG: PilZ domain-containing protein [Gammaproteobacteria bacterium]|nr:PilZ domain-containing protein [Gammaproteobacteria bacterium]MCP5196629.1 PilZ domain-containing protein [Gammaproteobacteria bacterium]
MSTIPIEREKREYYRLQFPPAKRPQLLIDENGHAVIDCSAHGIRYVAAPGTPPSLGEHVKGLLRFRHGAQTPILGVVLRVEEGEIVLCIPDREIPSTLLRSEERHLLKAPAEVANAPVRSIPLIPPESSSGMLFTEGEERREFHRIHYPMTGSPSLFLEGKKAFLVMDISARGLRYAAPKTAVPNLYQVVKGVLHFRRRARLNTEGTVIRAQNDEIALYLHQEIPLNILLAEQRHLHRNFPMWSP